MKTIARKPKKTAATKTAGMRALAAYARDIGRTPFTLWRWRKNGWLTGVIDIAGRPYITQEGIELFESRAAKGDFSKAPHGVAA